MHRERYNSLDGTLVLHLNPERLMDSLPKCNKRDKIRIPTQLPQSIKRIHIKTATIAALKLITKKRQITQMAQYVHVDKRQPHIEKKEQKIIKNFQLRNR